MVSIDRVYSVIQEAISHRTKLREKATLKFINKNHIIHIKTNEARKLKFLVKLTNYHTKHSAENRQGVFGVLLFFVNMDQYGRSSGVFEAIAVSLIKYFRESREI